MRQLLMLVRFKDQATPPEGDPPRFAVSGASTAVRLLEGDEQELPTEITYETDVTLTGETSFTEDGTMTFGPDGDRLSVVTVGEGLIGPSPEERLQHGAVIWRLEDGSGRFAGASGLAVSDFAFEAATGEAHEHQLISVFLP